MPTINGYQTFNREEVISNEVREFIGHRPHWVVRKGIGIFSVVILVILFISWLVQYPDIVNARVRIVAINAPKLMIAKVDGKLEELLVGNEQLVSEGKAIAYLQSVGDHTQVLTLKEWIEETVRRLNTLTLAEILDNQLPPLYSLGELQPAFQEFQTTLNETTQILSNGYYIQKQQALLQDLKYLDEVKENTQRQENLLKEDYKLQEKEYKAKETLAKEKIIAPLEFNQDKSKIINKQQSLELLSAQTINNKITEHNKRKELLELNKIIIDQRQKFKSSLFNLKSTTDEWINKYIVLAPTAGKVIYVSFLEQNQHVNTGQELFYIEPDHSNFYGELHAGQQGFGKVTKGQKVIIKVESYPSDEFGYLSGHVEYISNIPDRNDSFLIKVSLPDGLNTNYKKNLLFRNNLSANGEIVTDNRRLLERFLGGIKQVFKRN